MTHRTILSTTLVVAAVLLLASVGVGETTLLSHFDITFDADFSTGDPRASIPNDYHGEDIKLVPGRFGKGVFIRKFPEKKLLYMTKDVLDGSGGTIEFWYRPEWDDKTIQDQNEGQKWLAGKPVTTYFIDTSEEGSGISLSKNQYNVYAFHVTRSYRLICSVEVPIRRVFKQADEWVHLAVAWDTDEARLFANGRLLAVSDEWNLKYFDRLIRLGWKGAASGTYDEFRISDTKRYVGSFPLPDKPLDVDKAAEPVEKSAETPEYTTGRVLFDTDFSKGLGTGWSNRELPVEPVDGTPAVRLQRYDTVDDNLCYPVRNNLHPALGTVELTMRPADPDALPAVLFDCSHLGSWRSARTGMRLVITRDRKLQWQCLADNKVIDSVTSKPIPRHAGRDIRVALSWAGSTIALYFDGEQLAKKQGCSIPARLGDYFFIGSDDQGEDTFDGWVRHVTVALTDKPLDNKQ